MLRFDGVGTLGGLRFRAPAADACMVFAGGSLTVINTTAGETAFLSPVAGGAPVVGSFTLHGARQPVTIGGMAGGILPDSLAAARAAGADGHSLRAFLSPTGGVAQAVEVMAVTLPSGQTVLYAARLAGSGIDAFTLAALNTLASLSASLNIALAAIEPGADIAALWDAAELEADWQVEQWGEDHEATVRRERRLAAFTAAARFAELAHSSPPSSRA